MPVQKGTAGSRCTPTCARRWPCAASPRASARGGSVTQVSYRLRRPVYAPADLLYTGRVTAVDGDSVTLELIEENPSGEVGFEGSARASKIAADATDGLLVSTAGAAS